MADGLVRLTVCGAMLEPRISICSTEFELICEILSSDKTYDVEKMQ